MAEFRRWWSLAVALVAAACAAAPSAGLSGVWVSDGPRGGKLVFAEDGSANWIVKDGTIAMRYRLDKTARPNRLDFHEFDGGPLLGKWLYGIVEFTSETSFRFDCEPGEPDDGGANRPAAFTMDAEVYRRVE